LVGHNCLKNFFLEKSERKPMGWAGTEFETIDLSAQPTASMPQACGGWVNDMAA